jgi:bacterioferritin-associated ferredoxin
MIICSCIVVSDREVDQAIASGARTASEVSSRCGAGQDCGSCLSWISARCAAVHSCAKRGIEAADEGDAADAAQP